MTLNFRSIISFLFLTLVLVMSSGLTIYSRTCDEGCEKTISLNEEDACCSKENEKKEEKKGCCAEEQHDHGEDDDCCDTEAFSLDVDFFGSFHKISIEIATIETPTVYVYNFDVLVQFDRTGFTDLPPPDLNKNGRTILLKKNSFLI